MCGRIGQMDFVKALHQWGGPGFESHGIHIILTQKPIQQCHVAAHDWAMWHHTINQNNAMCHIAIRPHLSIDECHVTIYLINILHAMSPI